MTRVLTPVLRITQQIHVLLNHLSNCQTFDIQRKEIYPEHLGGGRSIGIKLQYLKYLNLKHWGKYFINLITKNATNIAKVYIIPNFNNSHLLNFFGAGFSV